MDGVGKHSHLLSNLGPSVKSSWKWFMPCLIRTGNGNDVTTMACAAARTRLIFTHSIVAVHSGTASSLPGLGLSKSSSSSSVLTRQRASFLGAVTIVIGHESDELRAFHSDRQAT